MQLCGRVLQDFIVQIFEVHKKKYKAKICVCLQLKCSLAAMNYNHRKPMFNPNTGKHTLCNWGKD
jgi:hypothetical protein